MYNNIKISNWRQFENIDINFDEHLTILTGANGAGKTTLLNILSKPLGRDIQLVKKKKKDSKTGLLKYFVDFFRIEKDSYTNSNKNIIGNITYDNKNHNRKTA